MGVNTWLMKGFFDTIPAELDESARVDGATPAQVFWGVDPPARRARARGRRAALVHRHDQRVRDRERRCCRRSKHQTLPVGLLQLHQRSSTRQRWGPFAAGVAARGDPGDRSCSSRCRSSSSAASRGRRQGMTRDRARASAAAARRAAPRRLGRVRPRAARRARRQSGRAAARAARVVGRHGRAALRRRRRAADRRRRWSTASRTARRGGARRSRSANPATRYRWLLAGGEIGWAWVNGTGVVAHDVPDDDDFVLDPADRDGPAWHLESVVYEIFPDRFASSGLGVGRSRLGGAPRVGRAADPDAGRHDAASSWFGGDLRGVEQHLDHIESLGANALYLTPIFPAGSAHRYDATTFDARRPAARRRRGAALAARRGARARHPRRRRPDDEPRRQRARVVRERASEPERDFFYFDERSRRLRVVAGRAARCRSSNWRSDELRAADGAGRPRSGSTSASTAGGSTSRT